MLQRAYSVLEIKAVDEEQRTFEGVATTPTTDRMDDIVEPMGAEFALPMPLLWQHESREAAIGEVFFAKPTPEGIPFKARVASDDVPGPLKDRLDYAWRSITKRLVRGVSIGFNPKESVDIEGSWGKRFTRWEWIELSAVTIPANAEATITTIKSLDIHRAAATGTPVTKAVPPGASGSVRINPPKPGVGTMNITDQIKDLEGTRQAKHAERMAIQEKASKDGRTKDEAEREAFDTLGQEIKSLDSELADLRELEASNAAEAKPVAGVKTIEDGAKARSPKVIPIDRELPKGIRFARLARCKFLAQKSSRDIGSVVRELYPDDGLVQKAAVAGGSTVSGNWAANLVGEETSVFADFVEFLRPQTILGKFGANGVPSLRRVPFDTPLIGQTGGGAGYWVGEGKAKPLTSLAFGRTTLGEAKVANIAVVTEELLRRSSPSAEQILRDSLAAALRERLDTDFVDPAKIVVSGVSPASITNGVATLPSSGNDADAVRDDIKALFGAFIAANNAPTNGVWIMPATTALALSLMVNALGQPEFPGITMNGGMLFGLPVIVSEYVPTDSNGAIVILANASDIYFGDEGGVAVDFSREASLEMSTTPTQNAIASTPTPAQLVSMFQTNSVAFRAERTVNWAKRRDEAVQVLQDVNWGASA